MRRLDDKNNVKRGGNISVKLRGDDAVLLKQVAAKANAKIIDIMKLWPRCPRCGFPLTQIANNIFCLNCNKEYELKHE